MYVMWLTVIFPDLCRYVYTYTTLPPMAPARPPPLTHNCLHNARSWRRWGQKSCLSSPTYRRYKQYQLLTCLRQLLWNQLPLFRVYETVTLSHRRCVTVPMYKIPYPPSVMVSARSYKPCAALPIEITVQCWTLYHIRSIWHLCNTIGDATWTEASREFSALTSKYIWNIFLQSCVKRQAQRITSWEPTWQTYTILY